MHAQDDGGHGTDCCRGEDGVIFSAGWIFALDGDGESGGDGVDGGDVDDDDSRLRSEIIGDVG